MHTAAEQQRCRGMAQIVKPDTRESRALQQRNELSQQKVASVLRLPKGVGKDKVMVLSLVAEQQARLRLSRAMSP